MMKLLSMIVEGQNRAGILIGEEVLDVTGFCEIMELKGGPAKGDSYTDSSHVGASYRDALDVHRRGSQWMSALTEKIAASPSLAGELRATATLIPLSTVRLNPPILAPGKILAVGLNYAAHAAEGNAKPPDFPLIFSKNVTALIGAKDEIKLPRISEMIDYEAELAVVIGKEAKSVTANRAMDYVAGYTIMNDVSARDIQKRERQWVRAKGLDTFAPCGPWLVTTDEISDPHTLDIQLHVNGEMRQHSNTSDLIFKVPQLIEFVSQDLTLNPGDIISTGTPSGVGAYMDPPVFLKDGDMIEITIENIGTLVNTVGIHR
jgi:2-keto-4-pentenoate hydratase/2-oxohepta-3-ene-1,7-dioic acid hydratase in catechol pathway